LWSDAKDKKKLRDLKFKDGDGFDIEKDFEYWVDTDSKFHTGAEAVPGVGEYIKVECKLID
jgi:hypothetical protein